MRFSSLYWAALIALGLPALPALAREEPNECPGTYDGPHPACPPAEALAWVNCPPRWPGDPSKKLKYGELYYSFNDRWPDVERANLDRHPEGGQLFCQYGTEAELGLYQQIIDVSGPMIQWGWHKERDGRTVGVRVPKEIAARLPVVYVIEPVTERTTLAGFRLGMTRGQVREAAAVAAYAVSDVEGGRMSLSRQGGLLDIAFNSTGKSAQIIQPVSGRTNSAVQKDLVLRFGFDFRLESIAGRALGQAGSTKTTWVSRDKSVAIEAWASPIAGQAESIRLVKR